MNGLLTLDGMSATDLEALLDRGDWHRDRLEAGETPRSLQGLTVTTAFFEPSTRTRLSFERAASLLGAHVMGFLTEGSSTAKGESFRDTIMTLTAMGSDVLVIRHHLADGPALADRWTDAPVVNAGSGRRAHPTQTLIDAMTMRRHFGSLAGLRMAIVGDITNSRVARSHLSALPVLGVEITLIAPPPLLPAANPWRVRMTTELDDELGDVDVVYLLRVQRERGAELTSESSYARAYGVNEERLSMLKPTTVIMHPGPLNRGVEIDSSAADGDRSLILQQVSNGVPLRMAVLEHVTGRSG